MHPHHCFAAGWPAVAVVYRIARSVSKPGSVILPDVSSIRARGHPRRVWVVRRHGLRDVGGLVTEVLLVDDALRPDDERHHAARAVLRRIRDEREAARHLAVLEVALGAAGRVRALLRQDPEDVAVVGLRAGVGALLAIPFGGRLREERAERARVLAGRVLPVEAVALAGVAAELLRVVAFEPQVLALRVDVDA